MKSAKFSTHLLRGCHTKMPLTELLEDEDAALLRVHLLDVVEPDKGLERERMHISLYVFEMRGGIRKWHFLHTKYKIFWYFLYDNSQIDLGVQSHQIS